MKSQLQGDFYSRPTADVAKALVGMRLVRTISKNGVARQLSGIIVETEAYGGIDDLASHARMGPTNRNLVMFGKPGRAYVYFTYGAHHCVNVTAKAPGREAGAVLLRALEPLDGIDLMISNRSQDNLRALASGPGKLTQALGIGATLNGADVTDSRSELRIEYGKVPDKVIATPRIGITRATEIKWRFIDAASNFVSQPSRIKIR